MRRTTTKTRVPSTLKVISVPALPPPSAIQSEKESLMNENGGGYFGFVFLDLPKLAGSFKLTAKGSKAHSKSMGCQIPDSEQEAVTWLTFSAPERNTFILSI